MLGRILKADERGGVRGTAIAAYKHDLPGDRLRETFKDGEGGQAVLQSFLVDEKRVPLVKADDFKHTAADE